MVVYGKMLDFASKWLRGWHHLPVADRAGEALTSSRVGVGSWRQESVQQHQPGLVDQATISAETILKPGPA